MELKAIQEALRDAGLGGWLFCDFHHRDPLAYRILGLDMRGMTTRRWFYFVPAQGDPRRLAHRVEPRKLDGLPGALDHFTAWTELHEKLKTMLGAPKTIAMQYSPSNDIPYVGIVDAGTVELVRSFGHDVVSSADLVQRFDATLDEAGIASHAWAGERVLKIKDEAFALMGDALRSGRAIAEHEVARFILDRFEEEGMTSDGDTPIVGFNDHPADPHFEPTADNAYRLKKGDTILVDLWARKNEPGAIYYDVTWCGFAGDAPPAEYGKIFEVVRKGRDAAVALVETRLAAGESCRGWEIDDACRSVVVKEGYGARFVHRTGHSIGTSVHGNGVNIDNLETRDGRRITPGVCFSVEPGIYLPGKMAVRTEIDVVVTLDGKAKVFGPRQSDLIKLGG